MIYQKNNQKKSARSLKKNKKLIELYGFVKSVNVSYNMVFKADKNASYIMIYPSWRITRKGKIIQSSDVYPFHSNFQVQDIFEYISVTSPPINFGYAYKNKKQN